MSDAAARLRAIAQQLQEGRVEQARDGAEALSREHPQSAQSHLLLGTAQRMLGDLQAAHRSLQRALALAPQSERAGVHQSLGLLYLARYDAPAAAGAFSAALEYAPHATGARLNLAGALLQCGDAVAALAQADRALLDATHEPAALFLRGLCLQALGRHGQAAEAFLRAEREGPGDARFPYQRGLALEAAGEHEAAALAFAAALHCDPNATPALAQLLFLRRRLCDWDGLEGLSAQVCAAVRDGRRGVTPFSFLSEPASAAEQLACARSQAAEIQAEVGPAPAHPVRPSQHDLLRVGFLSNGFGAHPTGSLTVAMFEHLRQIGGIEVHLFALNADDGSPIRQRLQQAAHALHDVGAHAVAEVVATIRAAGIDVLFDLRGWGGGGTPQVLAVRPAPVQVNWLAYPGTSGAPWIDYVIADRFVLPESLAPHFSETVAWLPRCFQPSDTTRVVAAPPTRAECGLPAQGTVFCSFNNSYKIGPDVFARTMRILRAVPDSTWWLLAGPGRSEQRLRAATQAAGVDPRRLVFMPKLPQSQYLARLQLADLFLDSDPYNAHTTASDALWAGCPVLTRPGETFAARVAGSLNHHLDLAQMNAADDDAYVATAVGLGSDPQALAALRNQLAISKRNTSVFDMRSFAVDFAALIEQLAYRHRAGLPPAPITAGS